VKYAYIRIELDFGDLENLNLIGAAGWRVVSVIPAQWPHKFWVLMEKVVER
jgi:hypothetical protein